MTFLMLNLKPNGIRKSSLKFVLSYPTLSKQTMKIDSCYSLWNYIRRDVSLEFIMVPLLFTVFVSNIFMFIEKKVKCVSLPMTMLFMTGIKIYQTF